MATGADDGSFSDVDIMKRLPRWQRRPVTSVLLRAAVILVPVALGIVVALTLAKSLPDPSGVLATLLWWVTVLAVTLAVVVGARQLARRLLPLTVLYRLSLVFPDRAPARHKLALRAWSTRRLAAQVAEVRRSGGRGDATDAAELLVTLVAALGTHDARTRGHSERTRAYTDLIADELALPEADRERLRWAALLHDVGKLSVPAAVLGKDGTPDDAEWMDLRRHPDVGYELARPLHPFLGAFAETILHHHERIDGSGYPRGLAGDEINIGARIVAVADAFDAMTAARSYQPARPPEVARRELAYRAGTQFDEAVVRALLNVSIGAIKWVMGPLALLGSLPVIGGLRRAGQAAGAAGAVAAGMMALVVAGPFGSPVAPEPAPAAVAAADAAAVAAADAAEVLGVEIEAPVLVIDVSADPTIDPATVEVAAAPAAGDVAPGAPGTIVYRPMPGAAGLDQLAYRACRFDGSCLVGAVIVSLPTDGAPALHSAPPGVTAFAPGSDPADGGGGDSPPATVLAAPSDAAGDAPASADTTTTTAAATSTSAPTTTTSVAPTTTTTAAPATTVVAAPAPTTTTTPPAASTTTTPSTTTTSAPPGTTTDPGTTTPTTQPATTATTVPATSTTQPTGTTTTTVPGSTATPTTTTLPGTPTTTTTTTVPGTPTTTTTTTTIPGTPTTTTTTTTVPGTPTTTTTTTAPPDEPPDAKDDSAETFANVAVAISVLDNDTDEDVLSLSLEIVGAPSNGVAMPLAPLIEYAPLPGFVGEDRFRYRICDGAGQCSEADVRVTVRPVLLAGDDTAETRLDKPVEIDVLKNDENGGSTMAITAFDAVSAQGGIVVLDPKGGGSTEDDRLVYTPPLGWDGSADTFSYTITNQLGATDTATVTVTGKK